MRTFLHLNISFSNLNIFNPNIFQLWTNFYFEHFLYELSESNLFSKIKNLLKSEHFEFHQKNKKVWPFFCRSKSERNTKITTLKELTITGSDLPSVRSPIDARSVQGAKELPSATECPFARTNCIKPRAICAGPPWHFLLQFGPC
jgi:hypothetical protein